MTKKELIKIATELPDGIEIMFDCSSSGVVNIVPINLGPAIRTITEHDVKQCGRLDEHLHKDIAVFGSFY